MEHAFTLSHSVFSKEDISPWLEHTFQLDLDLLAKHRLSWEEFLRKGPIDFCRLSRLVTSKENYSILHLAVLSNRLDLVQSIVKDVPHLKLHKNAYGLTPLELARLLPREEIIAFLSASPKIDFCDQPNVFFENREYFKSVHNLTYLSHPLFESEEMLEEIRFRAKQAKAEDNIPTEKIWMGSYFDHELLFGLHPKVSIRHVDNEVGFGVFAGQKISACAFVGEYTGRLLEMKKKDLQDKCYCIRYAIWSSKRHNFVIDAEEMGNFTRFINHDAKPNVGVQSVYWRGIPRMIFIALEDILEGTQLTFDYGPLFWKDHDQRPKKLS